MIKILEFVIIWGFGNMKKKPTNGPVTSSRPPNVITGTVTWPVVGDTRSFCFLLVKARPHTATDLQQTHKRTKSTVGYFNKGNFDTHIPGAWQPRNHGWLRQWWKYFIVRSISASNI